MINLTDIGFTTVAFLLFATNQTMLAITIGSTSIAAVVSQGD